MKRETTEITLAEYRALAAKKSGRPRREREERTGLTTMLLQGWSVTHNPVHGYRLDHYDGATSGWCESEKAAVLAGRAGLRVGDQE